MYSSRTTSPFTLAIRFNAKVAEFLTDFANTHPEDFDRFERKWGDAAPLGWEGGRGRESFEETQRAVRAIWEGDERGNVEELVADGLGLNVPRREYADSSLSSLIRVNWREGTLWAARRDLNDLVWLALLAHSNRLAVCANKENECPTPFFVKKKANQKFCSDVCALPAQREFKRQWFREHGETWRKKWMKKQQMSKKTRKARNLK